MHVMPDILIKCVTRNLSTFCEAVMTVRASKRLMGIMLQLTWTARPLSTLPQRTVCSALVRNPVLTCAINQAASAMGKQLVLVTGGSGFLGSWCIIKLLQAGYRVRTTVRSLEREGDVRAMVKAGGAVAGACVLSTHAWTQQHKSMLAELATYRETSTAVHAHSLCLRSRCLVHKAQRPPTRLTPAVCSARDCIHA